MSGQRPFSRLEPGLPLRLLHSPLGAQHGSLDSIRIKEMSHICKQAGLSQSSSVAVGRRRRSGKGRAGPMLSRAALL